MKKALYKLLTWLRNICLSFFVFSLFFVFLYKFVPVYYTPLMFIRLYEQFYEGKEMRLEHKWIPLNEISQNLVQAVVASEDNLYLAHNGFDLEQLKIASKAAKTGKKMRGASTISQQTAKNVFLWNGRSYLRKALEAYFTFLIEFIWGKERIIEVYLNSIEMGDGIYGAGSISKINFKKNASQLSPNEAALIAATLPNPRVFNSAKPSAYIKKRQTKILSLMGKIEKIKFGYDKVENKRNE